MSKPIRKKLTITTEVLRTLSGNELETAAGGNLRDFAQKVKGALGISVLCFGKTGLCHGPDSEANWNPNKK